MQRSEPRSATCSFSRNVARRLTIDAEDCWTSAGSSPTFRDVEAASGAGAGMDQVARLTGRVGGSLASPPTRWAGAMPRWCGPAKRGRALTVKIKTRRLVVGAISRGGGGRRRERRQCRALYGGGGAGYDRRAATVIERRQCSRADGGRCCPDRRRHLPTRHASTPPPLNDLKSDTGRSPRDASSLASAASPVWPSLPRPGSGGFRRAPAQSAENHDLDRCRPRATARRACRRWSSSSTRTKPSGVPMPAALTGAS